MRAARLKHIVSIQKPLNTTDPRSGQKLRDSAVDWEEVKPVFAGVEPLRGRELIAGQQQNSEVTTRIVMRWEAELEAALDHTCSVLFNNVRYQILHDPINPDMRNKELQLMCKVVR